MYFIDQHYGDGILFSVLVSLLSSLIDDIAISVDEVYMIVHCISILQTFFAVRTWVIFGRAQMNVAHVSSSVVFPAK